MWLLLSRLSTRKPLLCRHEFQFPAIYKSAKPELSGEDGVTEHDDKYTNERITKGVFSGGRSFIMTCLQTTIKSVNIYWAPTVARPGGTFSGRPQRRLLRDGYSLISMFEEFCVFRKMDDSSAGNRHAQAYDRSPINPFANCLVTLVIVSTKLYTDFIIELLCLCVCVSHSVMSGSLRPHGL